MRLLPPWIFPALLTGCTYLAESGVLPARAGGDVSVPTVPPEAAPAVAPAGGGESAPPRRVLLVVADDLSAIGTRMYGADVENLAYDAPVMPTIERICDEGVRFQRAWSTPTCAPTRATMLTGRYNFRNGTVELFGNGDDALPFDEPTLPRLLAEHTPDVATAQFGKWNLGRTESVGGASAPNAFGWSHYAGVLDASVPDYFSWSRTVNGVTETSTTYITTQTVDDTIAWLGEQPADQPWVVWLAFTAPHAPFHAPPADLHGYALDGEAPPPGGPPGEMSEELRPYYNAASQAMDTELGRLLAWMEANGQGGADVIFIADNGAPPEVVEAPLDPQLVKGTTYEGGVHVPLCVAGPSVADGGRVVDAPVGSVDILATVLDLAGAPVDEVLASGTFDSQTLAPVLRDPAGVLARDWAYTEGRGDMNEFGDTVALLQGSDKLIRFLEDDDAVELYDLAADPFETDDLLSDDAPESASEGRSSSSSGRGNDDDDDDQGEDEDDDDQGGDAAARTRAEELGTLLDAVVASSR